MDPTSDVGLSMDPATRDRHGYAGGNPVGFVDVDGHMRDCGGAHNGCASPSKGPSNSPSEVTPGARQWAEAHSGGGGGAAASNHPSAIAMDKANYSVGARIAANIDGFWGAVLPGQSFHEAKQATLDASWSCRNMRSFGNGFLGGSACTTAYASLVPIPSAPGEGSLAKAGAKELTVGIARAGVDDAALGASAFANWAPYSRDLLDGRLRTYGKFRPARTVGEMAGNRKVQETNPMTGRRRTWMETYDHDGNVRIVNPKNGDPTHYMFDPMGVFSGTFVP